MSGSGPIYEYQRELTTKLEQVMRERDEARACLAFERVTVAELRAEVERLRADLNVVDDDRSLAAKRWQAEAEKAWRERDEARAEVERLRGILPELPPRAPDGGGLPRYGLYWRRPTDPLSVPMESGYWTPWHLAKEALRLVVERQRQAMLAAINDDSYASYDGAEVVSILKGVPLVTEGDK